MKRRDFCKLSASAVLAGILGGRLGLKNAAAAVPAAGEKAKVYFSREITPESLRKIYSMVNQDIKGKVAIKLHTGEPHGPNLLPRELAKALQADIPDSTIVECNVLYPSPRQIPVQGRQPKGIWKP